MRVVTGTVLAALMLLAALSSASLTAGRSPRSHELTSSYTYDEYIGHHGKGLEKGSHEYKMRSAIFSKNLQEILRHNSNPSRTYSKGVNQYTDWTDAELKGIRGGRREPKFKANPAIERPHVPTGKVPAASIDYRLAQPPILSGVKDQGMCGDCWAHAVTEAIESAYAKATGNLLVLSQQQITACTPAEGGCFGCDGFYPRYAYEYASSTQYIMEEWVYPFESYLGGNQSCSNMTNPPYPLKTSVSISGYMQIAPNRESDVIDALNHLGPLSILVDATAWSSYESGIFNGCVYDDFFGLDHAVLLVGYGTDETLNQDYWIVRNSWSASWGEHGYIRLFKNVTAPCGYDQGGLSCFAVTPQPAPSCGMCGVITDAQFPIVQTN